MPEIPITAYFPPVPSNPRLHSQARRRPSPPKRARPVDVSEDGRHSSRKKAKTPNNDLKGKQREYPPPASRKARFGSHWSPTQPEEQGRRVIEIEDTPPSSPVKPVPLRHATPPSSPLPELTPSPETELRYLPCRPRINPMSEVAGSRPSTSSEPASPYRCPLEFEFIPSSQTQTLDCLFDCETATPTCTLGIPLATTSLQSPEPTTAYPESALTSRSHFVPADCNSELDDFIASSQSPPMSLPIDPELELVPSSQTQEFFHSQRIGLYSSQEDEPKPRSSLIDQLEDYYHTVSRSRMSSPSEEPEFRVVASGAQPASSQASEPRRDDELASYESLPDVVKELQGMFGDTYESYPPDFPMSLR